MARRAIVILALFLMGGALAWWWMHRAAEVPPAVGDAPPPAPSAPALAPAPVPAPAESAAPAPPVATAPAATDLAPLAPAQFGDALAALVGRQAVTKFFQQDDFAHRVAATVDNLGREQASPTLWPVNPTPDRFLVSGPPGEAVVDPDNGLRYAPFVILVESLDLRQVVALYGRMYPALQQAYEDLGYPGRAFNDRVLAVIDLMLATPEPSGPMRVRLPEASGPVQPARPWLLYEFADPSYQSLPAGQRLLLRMGAVNERRMKLRLQELRALLATPPSAAAPGRR
jgi:hypothetical protein